MGDTFLDDRIPGPEGTLAEQFAEVGMSNLADDGSSKLILAFPAGAGYDKLKGLGSVSVASSTSTAPTRGTLGSCAKVVVKAPPGFFRCTTCDQDMPLHCMKMRGNIMLCVADFNNYAALTKKWKTHKNLKQWWSSFTFEQKVEWYRGRQSHVSGSKRSFDDIQHEETSESKSQHKKLSVLNHMSWGSSSGSSS